MHKGFSVSCVLAIWLILGQAQTVDETRIDKAIRTVKEFCLYGTQFDLKADAKGNLTFKNLRQPGGEGSVSVNVRESKGAAAIFEEKLRIIADTAVRDCMRPHLPTIIRAILDQTEPTTSMIPPEGETSTLMPGASATAQRQEKLPGRTKLVVLVPPFENLSTAKSMITYQVPAGRDLGSPRSSFNVDRYTEAPRSILEDILGEIGGVIPMRNL